MHDAQGYDWNDSGGDIHGQSGTVMAFRLGPWRIENVLAAFAPAETRSKQDGTDGVIGNGLLKRFHVIFDYGSGLLYLKPNESFGEPFEDPGGR